MKRIRALSIVFMCALGVYCQVVIAAGSTELISVDSDGVEVNAGSGWPKMSADGRYVAFESSASNLVPGEDTNGVADIFVHDRQTGQTSRVSVGSGQVQSNGDSYGAALSGDGRYVAYYSAASNLVAGEDTNGVSDIFLHDRQTGQTSRVSVGPGQLQSNGDSFTPTLSADGRYVAFNSSASNLVAGHTNGQDDIFVRDRWLNANARANLSLATLDKPDPIFHGGKLTYFFTVTNKGPLVGKGVTLIEILSSNALLLSAKPTRGTCTGAHVVVCRLGTLAKGTSVSVTVKTRPKTTAPDSIATSATTTAYAQDPNPKNNQRALRTSVVP